MRVCASSWTALAACHLGHFRVYYLVAEPQKVNYDNVAIVEGASNRGTWSMCQLLRLVVDKRWARKLRRTFINLICTYIGEVLSFSSSRRTQWTSLHKMSDRAVSKWLIRSISLRLWTPVVEKDQSSFLHIVRWYERHCIPAEGDNHLHYNELFVEQTVARKVIVGTRSLLLPEHSDPVKTSMTLFCGYEQCNAIFIMIWRFFLRRTLRGSTKKPIRLKFRTGQDDR